MIHDFLRVIWDDEKRKYFVHRLDIPGDEWQEITFGAALQLAQDTYRYQMDFVNQRDGTHLP